MAKPQVPCPLPDCKERLSAGVGITAHIRGHLMRGEAKMVGDQIVRVATIPLATEPYARKLRMDAVKAGEIESGLPVKQKRKYTRRNKTEITELAIAAPSDVTAPNTAGPFDLSNFNEDQLNALRAQLGVPTQEVEVVEEHSCQTTRAIDRMKSAVVMTQVAEMLETVPADQLLAMLGQVGRLSKMVRR